MEGRWNGEATVQTPSSAELGVRVCSTELRYDDELGVWHERQTLTEIGGISHSQSLTFQPSGNGKCRVMGENTRAWAECAIQLEELSEHVMLLTATSHRTGKPIIVETITVVDDLRRIRTVQRFDETGAFQCLYLCKEQRVIDAVSGAVVPVPVDEAEVRAGARARGRAGRQATS
jgi:hypothetical protein